MPSFAPKFQVSPVTHEPKRKVTRNSLLNWYILIVRVPTRYRKYWKSIEFQNWFTRPWKSIEL